GRRWTSTGTAADRAEATRQPRDPTNAGTARTHRNQPPGTTTPGGWGRGAGRIRAAGGSGQPAAKGPARAGRGDGAGPDPDPGARPPGRRPGRLRGTSRLRTCQLVPDGGP